MLSTFFDREPAAMTDAVILDDMPNRLEIQDRGRRTRTCDEFVGDLETFEQFQNSPLWEQVIAYRPVVAQSFHDSVVWREVITTRVRRRLPLIGLLESDLPVCDAAWFAAETGSYDIDCETAHTASSLVRGMLSLQESGIVTIGYLNEGYI